MLPFILEPRQAPILTAGNEAGTKQGITFTFTAERPDVAGGVLLLHPAKLRLLIDLFGM